MNLVPKNISKKEFGIIGVIVALVVVLVTIGVVGTVNYSNTSTPDEAVIETSPPTTIAIATTVCPTTICVETTVEPTVEVVEENTQEDVDEYYEEPESNNYYSNPSDYELDLLARTIYQEAGICSEYCQWLVGSTVLNLADERGGLESVVFDYNTFNVAYVLYDAEPSDLSYSVASRLLSGDRDCNVKAFRMDYYHNFGMPYTNVDGVYFSTY